MQDSIFLNTIKGKKTSRPPVWFMRQAGRVLPSYLELRNKHSFWHMMSDPELAAKVTLLPVNDLGVDAAILFSDILVIPYAMGMGLEFTDHGPKFDKPLKDYDDPYENLILSPVSFSLFTGQLMKLLKRGRRTFRLLVLQAPRLQFSVICLKALSSKSGFPDAISFSIITRPQQKNL